MKLEMPDLGSLKSSLKKPKLGGGSSLKKLKVGGSSVQLPPFVNDLYKDLRDRRLLPFVAVLVVAIVAVPFMFSEGSGESSPAIAEESAIEAIKGASPSTSTLSVVEATPGLRDYRRRLRARQPTDPFEQRYTGPMLDGAELPEAQGSSTTTSGGDEGGATSTSPTIVDSGGGPSPAGPAPEGGGGGGGGGAAGGGEGPSEDDQEGTLFTFAVDVKIVHSSGSAADGDKRKSEPEQRERVLPTTPLPGKKTEVVNYLGLSPKTRKPLFLVSTDVTGVFGEGKCAAGTDVCQLIELAPGFPQTFVHGTDGDRYKITVTDVEVVQPGPR